MAREKLGLQGFKASRPERWRGRGGSWTANCNASWEMEFEVDAPSCKEPMEDYKFPSAARGSRAATPLGWAPALRPPRIAALAARGGEVAERGQEVGAARPGARGAGTAGEGTAHLGTCPTPRGHLAYPSLAILICAMGIATPVAWGEGTFMEKKGRSGWKEPGWLVIVRKARIIRAETGGGVWWVGHGGAGSLDKENTREIGEGAAEWMLRKPMRQAWDGLGGMSRKALGREGWRRKDEKYPARPWKAQCQQR